jgi:hypothetical protein
MMQEKHAVPVDIWNRMAGKPVWFRFGVGEYVKFKMTLPGAILMFVETASVPTF